MGCCNPLCQKNDSNYHALILKLLDSHPLKNFSGMDCKNEFLLDKMSAPDNSPSKSKSHKQLNSHKIIQQQNKSSEQNYTRTIERLCNFKTDERIYKYPTTVSKSENNIAAISLKRELLENIASPIIKEDTEYLLNDNNCEDASPLNYIYIESTPSYTDLYESIIKDRPESSFLLFILGFASDNYEEKAILFLKVLEKIGPRSSMINFRHTLQTYIEMHVDFSKRLYSIISSSMKKNEIKKGIRETFKIVVDDDFLNEWSEYEMKLSSKKSNVADSLAFKVTKDLLVIMNTSIDSQNIDISTKKYAANIDGFSFVEIGELMLSNHLCITKQQLTSLQIIHPYLFNGVELQKLIINESILPK